MIKVGLCGGIGSGKSTVCRLFSSLGIAVYIADDQAKRLMISSPELICAITDAFGAECYVDGVLNRSYLAAQIFSDNAKREKLNSIVHPAVCRDFVSWAEAQDGKYVVVESAILFESGLDKVVDISVAVVVDSQTAIERAMARDGASRESIEARMAVQMTSDQLAARADYTIDNTTLEALKSQVVHLDKIFRSR